MILHVQERLEARNQPLGVRNVVHIKAAPGCCITCVIGELNADPAHNYGAGAMRKAAIAEAITRPDARQQCWGSITRWLLLDNERRNGRGESLAHGMGGLKVR